MKGDGGIDAGRAQRFWFRIRRIPDLLQLLPIQNWGWNGGVQIVGQPPVPLNQEQPAEFRMVTSGYYRVFGMQLLRGR